MTEAAKTTELKKKLTFDEVVLKKIVGVGLSEVPGILGLSGNLFTDFADRFRGNGDVTKGITVEMGTKQVAVDVSVLCEYGKEMPALFAVASEKVKEMIKYMTGLELVEFTMNVDDILSKEEYLEKYRGKERKNEDSAKN